MMGLEVNANTGLVDYKCEWQEGLRWGKLN